MSAAGITPHRPKATDYDRDDRATVAVLATVLAAVVVMVFHARMGSADRAWHVAMLGVSLFISVAPFVAWRVSLRGHYDEPPPWWRSQPTLTIVAIAITAATGIVGTRTTLNPLAALSALGFLSAAAAILLWIRQGRLLPNLIFIAGSGVFALWICGVAWTSYRKWATLAGSDTQLDSPGLAVIIAPLFFAAILLLAVEVKKDRSGSKWAEETERPLRTDYAAWFFLIVISIGVIPSSGMEAMGIDSRGPMLIGPDTIAVSLVLLAIATTIAWWRRKRTSQSAADFVFLLLFAPLVLVIIGVISAYLMFLLVAAGIGIGLLGRLFRDRLMAGSAVVCLAVAAVTWRVQTRDLIAPDSTGSMSAVWWPYFLLVNLFWSWLYIYLRVREERLDTVGAIRGAALEGRITDVAVVAIVTLMAIAGWLTKQAGGGEAFVASASDLVRWLTLSLFMASAWRWLTQRRKQREDSAPSGGVVGSIRISQLWLAALAIPVGITILLNVLRATLSIRH